MSIEQSVFHPYLLQPSPEMSPLQVVQFQLRSLRRNNDKDDLGIAACFMFASPANKMSTGPAARFARMIRNPLYEIMLNHTTASFAPIVIQGRNARQRVILTGQQGESAAFIFSLSRQQTAPYWNCWMTDGVMRD